MNINNKKKKFFNFVFIKNKTKFRNMISLSYSLYQLEWYVFNTFLYKLKKISKTYNEKTRYNKIIQEAKYLHEYKRKKISNIIYMNDILYLSLIHI